MDYYEVFKAIKEDHKKVFASGQHEMKWIYDGVYIVTAVGVPFSTRVCDVGLHMVWNEKEGEK